MNNQEIIVSVDELKRRLLELPDGEIHLIPIQGKEGDDHELRDGTGLDPDGKRAAVIV